MRKIVAAVTFLLTAASATTHGEQIEPGKTGEALLNSLQAQYRPSTVLGYRPAREKMFAEIDNKNGKVRLVYTLTINHIS